MAETERDFATLQAQLADNTTKAITPLRLRDLMVSALGGFSSLYVDGGSAAQALTGTFSKLTPFDTGGPSRGATADTTNDELTINTAGQYFVTLDLALDATVQTDIDVELRADAVKIVGSGTKRTIAMAPAISALSIAGIFTLAAGQKISVYGKVNPNASVTIRHGRFVAKRVG
jgi:hypothetical protein